MGQDIDTFLNAKLDYEAGRVCTQDHHAHAKWIYAKKTEVEAVTEIH